MAQYASVSDLKRYLDSAVVTALVSDSDGNSISLDALLQEMSAEIDAALRAAGFSAPLAAPYGGDVVSLTCRLAVAALLARRPEVTVPEHIAEAARNARSELAAIARRALILSGTIERETAKVHDVAVSNFREEISETQWPLWIF